MCVVAVAAALLSSAPGAVAQTEEVPAPPTDLLAFAGNGEATVSWSAPASGPSPDFYDVVLLSEHSAFRGSCYDMRVTNCTVDDLANGERLQFEVSACVEEDDDTYLCGEAALSAFVTTSADARLAPPRNIVPAASDGSATITWTAGVPRGVEYEVTPNPLPAGGPTNCGTRTTCTVTGLENGTTYTFEVAGCVPLLVSLCGTDTSAAVTPSATATGPAAPGNVTLFGSARSGLTASEKSVDLLVMWTEPAPGNHPHAYYSVLAEVTSGTFPHQACNRSGVVPPDLTGCSINGVTTSLGQTITIKVYVKAVDTKGTESTAGIGSISIDVPNTGGV